ncbi:MAG: hypothetical protein MUP45_04895 [Candidatus Marinimicrobia bacterium]|nr:hypothetical protein [Candidatus Neomarinimicrobiota bacterium]
MSPENGERLNYIIEMVDDAERIILGDARQKVMAFDWEHFGVDRAEMEKLFRFFSRIILRQSNINSSLNLLDDNNPEEYALLCILAPHQKKESTPTGRFWLVLFRQKMTPEEATFIRDWLWAFVPEVIAKFKKLDVKEVEAYFISQDTDGELRRLGERIEAYIEKHKPFTEGR